jgi:hypothetical protein
VSVNEPRENYVDLKEQRDYLLEELHGLQLMLQLQDAAFKETLDALGAMLEVAEQSEESYYEAYARLIEKARATHTKYTQEHPDA